MQAPSPAKQASSDYEAQAHEATIAWSQRALSSADPLFDIAPARQADIHGSVTARHRLSVETDTTRWHGRIKCQADDILCNDEHEFEEALREQGLLALYNTANHEDLKQRVVGADYAAYREPTVIPLVCPALCITTFATTAAAQETIPAPLATATARRDAPGVAVMATRSAPPAADPDSRRPGTATATAITSTNGLIAPPAAAPANRIAAVVAVRGGNPAAVATGQASCPARRATAAAA